ncbi:MAG: cold shock domain-containing protein [Lachnospiraceae bacterium]|nr:cold shock domain-containing protein [Lachnospiraceae bacterium]
MTGRTVTGTVRWFSARRGYGFITQDGTGKDFYVHYSEIVGTGFRKLTSGEAVEFEVGKDQDDRPVATNVVQLAGFTAIDDPKGGQYGL